MGNFSPELCGVTELPDGVSKKLGRIANTSQKGLGGIPEIADPDHEIFELGLSHATINVVLNALISDRPRPNFEKVLFEGEAVLSEPWFFCRDGSAPFSCSGKNGITVTGILLVSNQRNSPMVHPESESRGKFVMPNLREPRGTAQYLTALRVLGNHFTQPGYRISNWVVHNEFDQAGTWTNMGDQPVDRYLESYSRSARLIYSTMRGARSSLSCFHLSNSSLDEERVFRGLGPTRCARCWSASRKWRRLKATTSGALPIIRIQEICAIRTRGKMRAQK